MCNRDDCEIRLKVRMQFKTTNALTNRSIINKLCFPPKTRHEYTFLYVSESKRFPRIGKLILEVRKVLYLALHKIELLLRNCTNL